LKLRSATFQGRWIDSSRRGSEAWPERPGAEVRLTFDSLPVLLKNLTPARWTLLEALKRSGPMSINELARLLGRITRTSTRRDQLTELGLIDRVQDQAIAVAWDTIQRR
jgi:predicted transcriptional regulator